MANQEKIDRLQTQIRKFQSDLHDTQFELRDKIKALENVQVVQQSDLHLQLKQLTEQLNAERVTNSKLNADLAKSLELGLQLQLEIQNLKARAQQVQNEERKFSQTLQEKVRQLTHDLELSRALREELETERNKARSRYLADQDQWKEEKESLQAQLSKGQGEKTELLKANEDLLNALKAKEQENSDLAAEFEKMSASFNELGESALNQQEAMKNLTQVAENKIVELKLALDRKISECKDYEGHLQQSLTQAQLLKQENANLKDYISKINAYLQTSPSAPAPSASGVTAPAPAAPAT